VRDPPWLNSAIGTAIARSFLHRFIAKAFEAPERDSWQSLCEPVQQESFRSAVCALAGTHLPKTATAGPRTVPVRSSIASGKAQECSRPARPSDVLRAGTARAPVGVASCAPLAEGAPPNFESTARRLLEHLKPDSYTTFELDYIACFGHTVRGDCPMNEIEYGDIKADPLFQPHRLADLGAFYAAFGLEIGNDAAERQDHISIELEFMSVLAAKEAYALAYKFDDEPVTLVRNAQKKFLREHLGRWTPAFTRRLSRIAGDGALGALADFTREFITAECARLNVMPGSEDLLLRPIDDSLETLCASCGITSLPPGATSAPVET
jgi:TorA maturation chaperone TorD